MLQFCKDILVGAAVVALLGWTLAFWLGKGCVTFGDKYKCVEVLK